MEACHYNATRWLPWFLLQGDYTDGSLTLLQGYVRVGTIKARAWRTLRLTQDSRCPIRGFYCMPVDGH